LEADLDWMRWNNPDEWLNKELASYIITKESEWFTIPWDKFKSFLSELWKETGIEEIEWQLLMLMYLIGMELIEVELNMSIQCSEVMWVMYQLK
jgi:hypothetical protein